MDLPLDAESFGLLRTGGCACTPVLRIEAGVDGKVTSAAIVHVHGCPLGDALEKSARVAHAHQN